MDRITREEESAPLAYSFRVPVLITRRVVGTGRRSVAKAGHMAMDQEAERTPESSGAEITFKVLPLVTLFCQLGPTFSRCHNLQINTSRWGTDLQSVGL